MNLFFKWVFKNAWNLFGALGVAGTFYFSLMYVPDYVKDITTGKVNVIHESLMDDVQELIFYEKSISINDVDMFIRGKELKQGISYPYTSEELLLQVQERFMGNKFIPLEKRESLLTSINKLRANYTPPSKPVEKEFDWTPVFSWLLSAFGAVIAIIGASSIVGKLKSDKETEADIISGDIIINHHSGSMSASAYEYEKMVGDILSGLGLTPNTESSEYDFLVEKNGQEFVVEVKKYRKLLGLGTARSFLNMVLASGKGGVLVVSSGITQRAKDLIQEHNQISDNQKIHVVTGDSKDKVKSQLSKVFDL
ncbi:TPA: restriction endonuclease [Vibrio parahaemolyticus]|uniref:restriction endonuclease n=1 Tax=Vibrio parahaemolyticus TaxID=670 RepID=UPI002360EB79|nr:restriction endonuclease [Vibrio parahaemolyticus]EGR3406532.1 hypothetical protein [Vibrio parahaemolyticus]HCH0814750.1 restriction endonuclease [Vibrio parahaemolyticus]HCH0830424.1 restriction endonuclease [Vibrio parahaemolyticus]HCM0873490.1 restriction endonuclease [Vibrio parahaemolyticus]